jgi:signal transduction histidine kinase
LSGDGLSRGEIARRKKFLEFGPADARRLAALAPLARRYADEVIEELYKHFLSFEEARKFFADPGALNRVKRLQKDYFLRLTSGRYDRDYIANRLRVGAVHERSGVVVKLYLGAYRRYLDSVARRLWSAGEGQREQIFQGLRSLLKVVFLDIGLTIDTYVFERERTIRVQNQELAEQYRQVAKASRLKSEFLANMSHELRTPLNAIIGFSELLHDGRAGTLNIKQKSYVHDVLSSAHHLLQLIEDVLDLSRIEAGKMEFVPEPIDPLRLAAQVRDGLRTLIASKHITLRNEIDPRLKRIMLDSAKLKQVIFNYLSNALKFTPEGGRVTLRMRAARPDTLRVEIEDTGIGIRAEDIPRLFTQFEQLDASASKKYQGTGLGLALTKRIVEAQGGSVGVRSRPGRGSLFYAQLPLGQVPAAIAASNRHAAAFAATGSGRAASSTSDRATKVLLVGDDRDDLKPLRAVLRGHGYTTETADNALAALRSAAENSPGCVVLAVNMLQAAGLDFLRRLRTTAAGAHIPVIVLVAGQVAKAERRRLRMMAQAVVTEGNGSMRELLAEVDAALCAERVPPLTPKETLFESKVRV